MDNKPFRYNFDELSKDLELDLESISSLFHEYFFEMKSNIEKCRSLLSEGNWAKLERVIHNIKGTSSSLNVDDIFILSNKMNNDLKSGKYDDVEKDLEFLSKLYNITENNIREFFKQNNINI